MDDEASYLDVADCGTWDTLLKTTGFIASLYPAGDIVAAETMNEMIERTFGIAYGVYLAAMDAVEKSVEGTEYRDKVTAIRREVELR